MQRVCFVRTFLGKVMFQWFCVCLTFLVLAIGVRCGAEERPATGKVVERYAAFDQVINDHMDVLGATAASLAINSNGRLVFSRGYGWNDAAKSRPVEPENTFRIASCTKAITAAAVRNLIRGGKLNGDEPVFEYLGVQPFNGRMGDERLGRITVNNLLDHRGGWDRKQTFDPMYRLAQIKKELNKDGYLTPVNVIEYMLAQPLQNDPGEKEAYSNFGYLVLGRVVEKASGKTFDAAVQDMICEPLRISDLRLSPMNPDIRALSEVDYVKESGMDLMQRDSAGGFATSAPSLCKFLARYWVDGKRRKPNEKRSLVKSGSHPNSTSCLMVQRYDGIDYVVIFNSRRNAHWQEDSKKLKAAMDETIDKIKAE